LASRSGKLWADLTFAISKNPSARLAQSYTVDDSNAGKTRRERVRAVEFSFYDDGAKRSDPTAELLFVDAWPHRHVALASSGTVHPHFKHLLHKPRVKNIFVTAKKHLRMVAATSHKHFQKTSR
jgi:hypothetical protein